MSLIKSSLRLTLGSFNLDASFEAPSQSTTAVLGPSGSGKTTLLRCIAGLEPRTRGRLEVNGHVWQDDSTKTFLPAHHRSIGYVFQESSLFAHLNVRHNLEFALKRTAQQRVHFDQVVSLLSLEKIFSRSTGRLSGGERKRVALGRALLSNPELLLLDEPLAGLDVESQREVLAALRIVHSDLKLPILYVTHAREELTGLAEHVLLIEHGRVVHSGAAAALSAENAEYVMVKSISEPASDASVYVELVLESDNSKIVANVPASRAARLSVGMKLRVSAL